MILKKCSDHCVLLTQADSLINVKLLPLHSGWDMSAVFSLLSRAMNPIFQYEEGQVHKNMFCLRGHTLGNIAPYHALGHVAL